MGKYQIANAFNSVPADWWLIFIPVVAYVLFR